MMRPRAFTLVELLIVVSILAMLIAMLLPTLKQAQSAARMAACAANERTLTMGCMMYADSDLGRIPPHASDGDSTNGYLGPYWDFYVSPMIAKVYQGKVFSCPQTLLTPRSTYRPAQPRTYRYNAAITGGSHGTLLARKPLSSLRAAGRVILFSEDVYVWTYNTLGGWTLRGWGDLVVAHDYDAGDWVPSYHGRPFEGSGNLAFADGHVAAYHYLDGGTAGRVQNLIIDPSVDK